MATKLFNYTNQRLNANKLREVQAFNSSNFGGIVSNTSPFIVNGNDVTLVSPVTFLGGGVLLNQLENVSSTISNNNLWCLTVTLDSSVANITTDELIDSSNPSKPISKIQFNNYTCSNLSKGPTFTYFSPIEHPTGAPNTSGYYVYKYNESTEPTVITDGYIVSTDTSVNPSTDYYYKIEASKIKFTIPGETTNTYNYIGNTLWLNENTFIIPLYANIGGELVQAVVLRDLSDLEGLLSLSAYADLKKYLEENFVWSIGGQEPIGNHKKGDIGYLNITNDLISNTNNSSTVKISKLAIEDLIDTSNDNDTKLLVGVDGTISAKRDYIQPISHGGTGASDRGEAKRLLGIYYGTKSPTSSFPISNPQTRDIYFKIIE